MEGYNFDIVGEDIPDYKCPICLMWLRQAVLMPCSHSACKLCLRKWEDQGDSGVFRCPSCQKVYQRDKVHAGEEGRFVDRLITTSMKVKCKKHVKKCDWVGTISDYEIHEKLCQYASVTCGFTGCNIKVQRKDLVVHQDKCSYRLIKCKFCMRELPCNQLFDHHGICDYVNMSCPQMGCGNILKRKDIPIHIAYDCRYVEVSCPFKEMGCTQKILRRDVEAHVNKQQQHTNVLLHFTLKLTKEVKGLKETNTELRIEIEHLKQSSSLKICALEEKLEEKEDEINAVNRKVDDIENQLHLETDKISEDVKMILDKTCQLEGKLHENEKKSKENVSFLKKNNENVETVTNEKFAALLSLSSEDRSMKWTFKDLSNLIQKNQNEKFEAIINLRPKLAVLRNSWRSSFLHYACQYNNVSCIHVLLTNGCLINHENKSGAKPIHWAASFGSVDAAKVLLAIDATLVNSVNNTNKCTPLHYATQHNREEFVKYILIQPGIQFNLKNNDNEMADECTTTERIRQFMREHRSKLSSLYVTS